MATVLEHLQAARDNYAAQLAELSANPQPTYSEKGRSVSWTEHRESLVRLVAELDDAIAREGPDAGGLTFTALR